MRLTHISMYSTTNIQQATFEDNIRAEEPLNFNLGDRVPPSKFQVRSMVGLDAEDIAPKFYGFGARSGSRFYDFNLTGRDIVMQVALRPDYSIGETNSDVRDVLYRTISSNRSGFVMLHFNAGATNVARIRGQIVKFEVDYFDKEPVIQITIRCDDPMFRSITPVELKPEDVPDNSLIVYPNVNVSDTLSTSPHGFSAEFVFSGTSPTFTIRDVEDVDDYEWQFKVVPFESFIAGDLLHFSSEYGHKRLERQRGGTFLSLIDSIQSDSCWPIIFPGENKFYFGEGTVVWNYIKYYASYWGV